MGQTIGFIFARGGSKGVPRKNMRPLCGKPLIAHAITVAKECPSIDRVIVSTDDVEIADVAQHYGAEIPFLRPAELASDAAAELLSWKHAIQWVKESGAEIGTFVSVPATVPLRNIDDVESCIAKLRGGTADLVIAITPARRNPMYNMVVVGQDGAIRVACPQPQLLDRRQDAPVVYEICASAYVARPDFVMRTDKVLGGRTEAVIVPPERSIDIDTELDFQIAEFMMMARAGCS